MWTKSNTDLRHSIFNILFSSVLNVTSALGSFLTISPNILASTTILPGSKIFASILVSILISLSEPTKVIVLSLHSIYIPSNIGIVVLPVIAFCAIAIASCNLFFSHMNFIIISSFKNLVK